MLENRYNGMVDGVYEGWFVVLKQDELNACVMWSSMKDKENVVSITIEDWAKFADGTWGAVKVVMDNLEYEYTKENDIYYYNKCKKLLYSTTFKEEEEKRQKALYYELAIEFLEGLREAAIDDKEYDSADIIEVVIDELKDIKNR